jgi:hypothetical protein
MCALARPRCHERGKRDGDCAASADGAVFHAGPTAVSYILLHVVGTSIGRFPARTCGHAVSITRNADFTSVTTAVDLLAGMEDILTACKRGDCVRLETDAAADKTLPYRHATFCRARCVHVLPIDPAAFMQLADLKGLTRRATSRGPANRLTSSSVSMFGD